jgi:hypothetical protein
VKNWYLKNRRYVADVAERASWTFAQAFLAVWFVPVAADILNGDAATLGSIWGAIADASVLDKAAVGGIAAVISLGKGIIAKRIGSATTAATLPTDEDTPRPA